MYPTEELRREHEDFLLLIQVTDRLINEMEHHQNQTQTFWDVTKHFHDYVRTCHSAKETQCLFPQLQRMGILTPETVNSEHFGHQKGFGMMLRIEDALRRVMSGDMDYLNPLIHTTLAHNLFIRSHMAFEEEFIFPLAEEHFTSRDWNEVTNGFAIIEGKYNITGGRKDFTALLSRVKEEPLVVQLNLASI